MDLTKALTTRIDRRRMLGNLGMMGAGAVLAACTTTRAQPPEERDVDAAILNFALNLEYLEAAFYLAAVGRIGDLPGGGAEVMLPSGFDGTAAIDFQALSSDAAVGAALQAFAEEIAAEELAHVAFLRGALAAAGAPVADRPVLNLDSSFRAAASAAGLSFASSFDPFANGTYFAHGGYIFEDVGVTAYKGAARYVTNDDYLEAAAGILAAEAYHAGTLRTFLYLSDATVLDFYGGLDVHGITAAISDARDALDGSPDLDQPLAGAGGVTGGTANIVVSDADGIAYSRTPAQVAAIVYLSTMAQPSADSFFPNGLSVPTDLAADFDFLLTL